MVAMVRCSFCLARMDRTHQLLGRCPKDVQSRPVRTASSKSEAGPRASEAPKPPPKPRSKKSRPTLAQLAASPGFDPDGYREKLEARLEANGGQLYLVSWLT